MKNLYCAREIVSVVEAGRRGPRADRKTKNNYNLSYSPEEHITSKEYDK